MAGFTCEATRTRRVTEQCSRFSSRLSESLNEWKTMQAVESDPDIMVALKASTSAQHAALERIMPFFKCDFSLDDYARVLNAFLGFFEPLEAGLSSISTWNSAGLDIRQRLRSNMLKEDLRSLGESTSQIALIQ